MHAGHGPAILRRLARPQAAVNAMLNEGLALLTAEARHVFALEPPPDDETGAQLAHLDWHVAEAAHLNARTRGGPLRFWRRARRDQFMINRCHIVALKQLCTLAARRPGISS
jgi:hypothetical protein